MDINLITKLAAAGAMGVSIFCIFKVYELLKAEQKKVKPRPTFLKSIYISMGFAVLMTILSLGIELVRHNMSSSGNDLEAKLTSISNKKYYSLNKNGNPEAIKITSGDHTYLISEALSDSTLGNCELKLKSCSNNRYYAIKETADKEIAFGYISNNEIKTKAQEFLPENRTLNAPELWILGMAYSPKSVSQIIKYKPTKDNTLAVDYFFKLIEIEDKESTANKENAIKLLTQPELMNRLKPDQYQSLIDALNSGYRASPWDKYELAQVYLSRSWQTWNKSSSNEDKDNYLQLLADYKKYYENNNWIKDTLKYSNEYKWYLECKKL